MKNWTYECECGAIMVHKENKNEEEKNVVNFICNKCGYDILTPFENPYINK